MTENSPHPAQSGKIVNVIGGTGLIGNHLIQLLSESPDIGVINIFVRKKVKLSLPKTQVYVIDFDDESTYENLVKGDALFCCLGTTIKKAGSQENFYKVDYHYPLKFAEAAKNNGIDTFMIVTAIGADSDSRIFYNRVKGEIETALQKIGFRQLFIFRPSLLLGKRKEKRFGENAGRLFFKAFNFLFIGPLKKYQPIPGEVVAASMLDKLDETKTGVFIYESNAI